MIHGLSNEFLYSAKRIVTYWSTDQGIIESTGTGFFISKDSNIYLITNRHVIELTYSHPEYKDAVLKAINLGGDTDTNAAICGGLAGIYYGFDEIPIDWIESIPHLDKVHALCEEYEAFCDEYQ